MKKTITATLVGGAIIGSLLGAGTANATKLSGSYEDWLAAICEPGSYQNGGTRIFPNSNGEGYCMAANRRGGEILIGAWDSNYVMTNDLTAMGIKYYSSWTDGHSPKAFAPYVSATGAELAPLTRFGFTINHL